MAKNKKSAVWKKNSEQKKLDIREKDYDFKFYATEFQKLLDKKYKILLDDGKVISLTFEKGNFYHLLGFHKFENTIFYAMINDKETAYSQQDFFDDVYLGAIEYNGFDHDKIKIPEKFSESIFASSFKEHELNDKTRHTLKERFPFFNYNEIIHILQNKEVIDFESNNSEYNVRATKIFFRLKDEKNRNLNIFVEEDEKYFVTSFYLETIKDMYKYKKDGTQMNILHMLCLYIEENENHKAIQFSVDWAMTREVVGIGCDTYDKMKKLLKKDMICTHFLSKNLEEIIKREEEDRLELIRLEYNEIILNLENEYTTALEGRRDEYELKLMEYDIDIESLELDYKELQKSLNKIKSDIREKKKMIKRLNNKIEEISLSLTEIEELDRCVLMKIYFPLIEKSKFWKDEFWDYFVHEYDYLRENITPRQLSSIYKDWKNHVSH